MNNFISKNNYDILSITPTIIGVKGDYNGKMWISRYIGKIATEECISFSIKNFDYFIEDENLCFDYDSITFEFNKLIYEDIENQVLRFISSSILDDECDKLSDEYYTHDQIKKMSDRIHHFNQYY